jgi:predicted porin
MQKKLLALAVAGALAPAAAMAQSTVEIYGRANLGIDKWEAKGSAAGSGADFKSRMRVYDGSSRLGFRVNESLGGGMRAFVVMETGVNIDTGSNLGQSGAANGSSGFWASRDSYLGLGGGWGDVRFGRQSIWWSNGVIAQTGANYLHTAADSLINDPGIVAIPVARQSNVLSYNSPTFGGFNASISYSPTSEAAAAGADTDGKIYGITGRYTTGALRAQIDWAKNESQSVTGLGQAEITGLKIGLGWAYAPGSQISGIWGTLENEAPLGVGLGSGSLEQTFWLLNWEHMLGQWQLLAQYYKSGDVEVSGLGVSGDLPDSTTTGFTLGAKYFLSKRTGVYVSYNQAKNDAAQFADFSGGGISSGGAAGIPAAAAGADVKIWAVGIMHNF